MGAPPAFAELSSHFGVLEKAVEGSGNGDAAFYLQRAKMAMIAGHVCKPARQADTRKIFLEGVKEGGVQHSRITNCPVMLYCRFRATAVIFILNTVL